MLHNYIAIYLAIALRIGFHIATHTHTNYVKHCISYVHSHGILIHADVCKYAKVHDCSKERRRYLIILFFSTFTPTFNHKRPPVMSEVRDVLSHGTTIINRTKTRPSNPIDLLGKWR